MKKLIFAITLVALLLTVAGCKAIDRPISGSPTGTIQVKNISVGNHTNYSSKATKTVSSAASKTASKASSKAASSASSKTISSASSNTVSSSSSTAGSENSSSVSRGAAVLGSTYSESGTKSGGGSGAFGGIAGTAGIIIIVLIIVAVRKGKGKSSDTRNVPPVHTPSQEDIIKSILAHDPNFASEKFLSWSKQVFVQLQEAWQERNWKKVRPFESEELFNLHKGQLDEFVKNGTINMMENVCVNEAYLYDYKTEGEYEYLTVFMQTSYNDYIIREDTKQVVKGDPNTRYDINYRARFMRSIGVTTSENSNASTTKCPNCGAPVDVNAAGQCAYCDTVITNGQHDWVLCNLDDVR